MKPLLYLLSILILPVLVLIATCFAIFREIINVILKIKYKNDYGGLLCSADNIWNLEDISRSIINATVLIKYNQEGDFYEQISKVLTKNWPKFPKLFYMRQEFLGYYYFRKNAVNLADCVKKIDQKVCTEEELKDFLSNICNTPLPKDSAGMFECYIGTKGIKWQKNANLLYPIIFRFHHSVGNGWAIMSVLQKAIFGVTTSVEEWTPNSMKASSKENDKFKFSFNRCFYGFMKLMTGFVQIVQMVLVAPIRLAELTYFKADEKNALHGCPLSGEKITVWSTEADEDLLPICKDIRRQYNIRFTDIVFSAVGGSLNKYFERNNFTIPEYVTAAVPVLVLSKAVKDPSILTNNMSMVFIDIPVSITPFTMLGLLKETNAQSEKVSKLFDAQIIFWIVNCLSGIIPIPLLRIILNNNKMSLAMTSLPGSRNLTVLHDCKVEDVLIYPPHKGTTGVAIAISTYNNKFQFTLMVDKALISSKKEAQQIVDDIFNNLRVLNEERKNIRTKTKKE